MTHFLAVEHITSFCPHPAGLKLSQAKQTGSSCQLFLCSYKSRPLSHILCNLSYVHIHFTTMLYLLPVAGVDHN